MRCAICGDQIEVSQPLVLPTTDGQHVHLMCAEREARTATRRRTMRAAVTGLLLAGLLGVSALLGVKLYWVAVLALLLGLIHICINRRWWHYMVQSAGLRWLWK